MPKRNYSNTAPPQALAASVSGVAVTLSVASNTGYPAAPFLLAIERGTANEEVVLCTAKPNGTSFTVTRGYDGTTAVAHALGAMVEHTTAAIDYREAGVPALTTAERDALTGTDLWDGRLISNITTDTLDRYDLDSTEWVSFARMSDVTTALATKAPSASPTFTGTTTIGGSDSDVEQSRAVTVETHSRNVTLGYTGSDLTTVTEKDGTTTVKTTTITYSSGRIATVQTVGGGVTVTVTFNYDGSGVLTGTTRSVS